MTKQDLKSAIKTIADQLIIGSIDTSVFDDLDLDVQSGVRKALKKAHFAIHTSDDGGSMYGMFIEKKAKPEAGKAAPAPSQDELTAFEAMSQASLDAIAFEEKGFNVNDPEHHDVFEGGKAGVEVKAESEDDFGEAVETSDKRAYTPAADELTLAFKELRHQKLADGRRIAFGKDMAGKDPISEQCEWLRKNLAKVGAAAITLRGKNFAGKVFVIAFDNEARTQVQAMLEAKLPGAAIEFANFGN